MTTATELPQVLVIDDEIGPRESLRMLLKTNYQVHTADCVEAGRCIWRRLICCASPSGKSRKTGTMFFGIRASGSSSRSQWWRCVKRNFFLKGAVMPHEVGGAPDPIYGRPAVYVYAAYLILAFAALIFSYWRDLRKTSGGEHAELAFVLIGAVSGVALALVLAFVLDRYLGPGHAIWFAPLRVVFISLVIAYGIATRKIMDVGVLVRRIISYLLLTGYLLALYIGVWWLVATALQSASLQNAHSAAHVSAAIVIDFAMAPARGISQRLADRLFVGARRLDLQATMKQAAAILRSVTTLQDLLQRFADTIGEAVDTDRVLILLPDKHGFSQQYPPVEAGSRYRLEMTRDQATIAQLEADREAIVLEELRRIRPTAQLQRVMRQLDSLQITPLVRFSSSVSL